ncbi:Aste57867_13462 [Aphanomyces stellatus]|uniref:Aste57867_13462 protein n=1 Tax=Aphanomyces stellatus TaxID=120398 RepID=A0A485KY68_9STRA|nr:hypothetical protein As57867_013412 [Aphanomyces stellatus]VFT90300.1 Aste57867_13462 [Aphanomyces stellatus]
MSDAFDDKALAEPPPATMSIPSDGIDKSASTSKSQSLLRRCVVAFVAIQVLWALVMPIKNVVIIPFPSFRNDDLATTTQSYAGYNATATVSFTGPQVLQLLQDVLAISLENPQVRAVFEHESDFAIDNLGQVLSPQDHAKFAQYYSLVFQSSEFPGGVFTPRTDTIVSIQPDGSKQTYTIGCPANYNVLHGTTCVDINGLPCDDSAWAQVPLTLTLNHVDFTPLLNDTGWGNSIGLLGLVEYFHYYMRLVFAKRNWASVVAASNLDIGFVQLSADTHQYVVETPLIFNFATQSSRTIAQNSTTIWNCVASELLLGEVYLANYTLGLIQTALVQRNNLYNASALINVSSVVTDRALVVLNGRIQITSGAGMAGYRDTAKTLGSTVMTHTTISTSNIKGDRPMTGARLIGSSMRNMIYMGYYPNSYYSVLTMAPSGSDYNFIWSALGGMFGGYNGFKFDFVHNTMTNFKLAERPPSAGTGYARDWYADEAAIANWYARYEGQRGTNNLIDMAVNRLGAIPNGMDTSCYQALYKKIAQVTWLTTLTLHPTAEHLAFQSVNADSTPQLFFFKQMLTNEVLGEDTYGYRVHVPFNPTNVSANHGTAWPLVPLLTGLLLQHGAPTVLAQLQANLNSTFLSLVGFQNGAFDLYDVNSCPIGATLVGGNAITSADTAQSAYNKLYQPLSLLLGDILAAVDGLRTRMESELGQSIQVRREYLNDTRSNSIFKYEGPPVYWTHSPLAVGLMRLSTQVSPDDTFVAKVKSSLVCYDVFETRYLNRSTRCWSEFNNVNQTLAQYNSEGVRTMLLSFWSMGIVLNLFAAVLALRFAIRVWHVAKTTGFQEHWSTLLCIDIEEFGLSTFGECALMAASAAPFMFSYQLPQDPEYISNSSASHLGSIYLDEAFITMGLTWYIRLGMDIGASMLHLRCQNKWFTQQSSTIRAAIIVVVYIVRISISSTNRTYNNAIWSLALSCLLTGVAGMVAMLLSYFFDSPGRPSMEDPISNALEQAKVARNAHCIFSQQGTNWSHMGLVLEGWTCSPDGDTLVFKNGTGNLLLIVRSKYGFEVRQLHTMNRDQFLALERTPSSVKASIRHMTLRPSITPEPGSSPVMLASGSSRRRWSSSAFSWVACVVVAVQSLWALSIPVRNILLFPYPTFNYDNSTTSSTPFAGFDPSQKLTFAGPEVLATIQKALAITVSNPDVRKLFEQTGDFSIDQVGDFLVPEDHETLAQLYALVFQSSEFPAGTFTIRQEKITSVQSDGSAQTYTVGCRADQTHLGGTTCVDATGQPCTSASVPGVTLTDIDFSTFSSQSGWQNNIALLSVAEYFHYYMRMVFSKQNWASVVAAGNRGLGTTTFAADGTLVETPVIFANVANGSRSLAQSTAAANGIIWNCVASELLLTEVYIAKFTLKLIQDALVDHNLYQATSILKADPIVQARTMAVFNDPANVVHITSAAGYYSYVESNKALFEKPMTESAISTAVLKRDLDLSNGASMGSNVRNLLTIASDVSDMYSLQRIIASSPDVIIETRVLGGMFGGYNGFKNDPLHNTMGVYKLSEQVSQHTSGQHALDYFSQEQKIADWYANYEVTQKASGNLLSFVVARFGTIRVEFFKNVMVAVTTDTYETLCYQALMRRVSQIVWLTALRLHPVLQYLTYTSAQNDMSDYAWFHQQMMINEVVGENAYGKRVHLPYNALFVSPNLGNGWPLIPLLDALAKVHSASFLHNQIMREMNTSFTSLIELELGLINFRDQPHCPIGLNTFGVTKDETLASLYAKIYPGFDGLVQDILANVAAVHTQMQSSLAMTVRVPPAYLTDTRTSSQFAFEGPPVQFAHTPLSVGLMRLSTKEAPFPSAVATLQTSMVCYNTLEARYLTTSSRCWAETLSSGEVRASYSSVHLRLVIFSAWAIDVIMNAIGEFISLRYAIRMWHIWRLTGLDLAEWERGLLLSTHLQSLGGSVTAFESAMLACSSLPLLFGYRLPQDPGFVASTKSLRLKGFDEFIMTLGLTWTIHLGMEVGSRLVTLHHKSSWFLAQNVAAKLVLTIAVYVLLIVTRDSELNYSNSIGSLIGIWCFALFSGFGSMLLSALFDSSAKNVAANDLDAAKIAASSNDEIADSFTKAGLPRNRLGYLSQQQGRWSLVGIVLEGWRGVATGPKSFLMACENVLLHLSAGGTVVPTRCRDISPADFDVLAQATNMMKKRSSVAPQVDSVVAYKLTDAITATETAVPEQLTPQLDVENMSERERPELKRIE